MSRNDADRAGPGSRGDARWRLVTLAGRLLADGTGPGPTLLAGAAVPHDGASVLVPPGQDVAAVLAQVKADLADTGREKAS